MAKCYPHVFTQMDNFSNDKLILKFLLLNSKTMDS